MFIVTWHLRHLVLLAFVHQKSHRLKGSWKWCTFIKLHVSPARTPQALVLSLRCPQIFSTLVWSNLRTLQSRSTLNCQHQIFWMPTELAHWNALRYTNQLSKFIILNFDYYKLPIRLLNLETWNEPSGSPGSLLSLRCPRPGSWARPSPVSRQWWRPGRTPCREVEKCPRTDNSDSGKS